MAAQGMGGFGDLGNMVKQAQKMQKDLARIQEDLKERVVEGTSGGGMVTAYVNGQQELMSIKITKDVVNPDDVEMLEDLVVAAVNQGVKNAKEMAQKEMSKVTGGMSLPGMF